MSTIPAVIQHSGIWNDENRFVNYTIDAIVFKDYASYENVVDVIAKQVGIDTSNKTINIKYMIEGDSMPLEIHNDMSVRVYVELKKDSRQFGSYPLCITTTDKLIEYNVSSESVVEGDLTQLEYNRQLQVMNTDDATEVATSNSGQQIVVYNDLIISNLNHKEIMVNQVYNDKDTLKAVMKKYAIDNRFQFRTERSNSISYTIVCISEQCEWKMKASSINKSAMFKVREFVDKHTCPLKDKVCSCIQASSGFIAGIIKPKLTNHKRKYTPKDIVDDVKNEIGVDVNYIKAYRAKEKAMIELRGEPADSYKKLPGYVYILDKTYPGNILPLAYGVIDSENDKSWSWFFQRFKEAYGVRDNMCIVYDRYESIIKVVARIYPTILHLAYIWHLWKNVYNNYRKSHEVLSGVYYKMAKAYTQNDFDMLMRKVEKEDIRVKEYLDSVGRAKWARLHCPVNRAWTLTSNIAESINAALVIPSTEYLHTVIDEGRSFIVCIEKKTCSCKIFQVDEIPCPHAWVVLKMKNLTVDSYCSNLYKPETVMKTYDIPIYPLPDQSEWNVPVYISEEVVLPPRYKRPPGRPKKKRDKSLSEWFSNSRTNSCSRCEHAGHNRRSCRNEPKRK
ncbi:uncharacterized protein LOC132619472 [Lycium barbarum]|uniref:uncharacterized protein LOC132619472 n=1 Tax=Lycium barbarum TaxID=112863 RepID=UPI00293E522D|nr:uncharacterized protein LOC132619472 [Lycium barbarum]